MTTTPKPGDRARITNLDSYVNIAHGAVVTIAEVDDTEGCWVGEDDGDLIYIGKRGDGWEPADVFHRITARSSGPDLGDMVHLIRHLRSYRIQHEVAHAATFEDGDQFDPALLTVRIASAATITEGTLDAEVYYVGPDGTIYDCNRDALWPTERTAP